MKKTMNTILFLFVLIGVMLLSSVWATENEYIVTKEYLYQNTKDYALKKAWVKIAIGSGDFTQYQDDLEFTIVPKPDEVTIDEYGNEYAFFDVSGIKPKDKFKVTVTRRYILKDYAELIPSRTNTERFEGDEIYFDTQTRTDLDKDKNEKEVLMVAPEDPEIISKAKELTDGIASDYKRAQAIFEFVNVNMEYNMTPEYSNQGAVSALSTMKGVCEEYATLFVSMCRAIGIPSRCVEGYFVQVKELNDSGEQVKELGNHLWAEIYLQDFGWVPVDPTMVYSGPSKGIPNLKTFCKLNTAEYEYMANGLYNPSMSNRDILNLTEISYTESLMEAAKKIPEKQANFLDLGGYDWAKSAIDYLYRLDVVKGYSEEKYGPQNNISRIEFISMLARTLRYKDTASDPKGLVYYYMDYDKNHWSKTDYDYLMRCYQQINHVDSDFANAGFSTIANIFSGKLDMNKAITRSEVVALMDVFLEDDFSATSLKDIRGQKFSNSIIKAYNSGLIVGYPDNTFRPNNNITRAEMALILERYIGGNTSYHVI